MNTDILKDKVVLITGGTGSLGQELTEWILKFHEVKKLIILSRDEFKQHHMRQKFPDSRLRFFLGDIRDLDRLQRAFSGVDIVIHAAALKQVPALEYNPLEAVKTNIGGTQNVIDAALDNGVKKVLLVSTDKAVNPINLYGGTKLCAEKLLIAANVYRPNKNTTALSVVRYGNVIGSRGSIVEALKNQNKNGTVNLTDERMTRFWITLEQSIKLILFALENMQGGEVFIPKIPSMKLIDLIDAVAPDAKRKIIGIRPGEKLHETLLTKEESRRAVELEKYFVVLPECEDIFDAEYFDRLLKSGKKVPADFSFDSDTNKEWLTKEQLSLLIENKI